MGSTISGVGTLDKSVRLLDALAAGPLALTDLVAATGLTRATAHRLATALERHGLVRRDAEGRFALGAHLLALAAATAATWPLVESAGPALAALRDRTGESAQLYVRRDDRRVCLASLESTHGLRTIVAAGSDLPLDRGSGGRVLLGEVGPDGWLASVAEREAGVASVSAPVVDRSGTVVAAVGVSGPIERIGRDPGPRVGDAVVDAARRLARDAGIA